MNEEKIKLFADCHCTLSESPMWNKKDKMLYWRGFEGQIYRKAYNKNTDDFECFEPNVGMIGSMVFTDSEYILLFADGGKIWKWIPGSKPELYKDFDKNLFNDCMTDASGRIYCGMLTENMFDMKNRGKYGSFWRFNSNGDFVCLEDKIGTTPNGIRFSPDMKNLYFAVTDEGVIYKYDYDEKTGELTNKRTFAKECCPDGIAVDTDGNVWVANCSPGQPLMCFNPEGQVIKEYYLPVYRVISVAFGGEDNKLLFITTASEGHAIGEHDGGVFVIENEAVGAEEYIFPLK